MSFDLQQPTIERASLKMLAIGAHPDDVEIGAAALLTKMREHGHGVHVLVLTDDPVNSTTRRAEARAAAAEMGIPSDRVIFAGIQDGRLRADTDSVSLVRQLTRQLDLQPDVVVTHTQADSHNDHVEANRIAHAAFRDCVFLHYSIHVSSEISHFKPAIFINVSPDRLWVKDRALESYHSQVSRIGRHDLTKYEEKLGKLARLDRAEGFEIFLQYGADDTIRKTIGLSDSPFHRFWLPTVTEDTVTLLYELHSGWDSPETFMHRNIARDKLRQAFINQWLPYPLREQHSNTDEALAVTRSGSIVTVGGPQANPVARECQNVSTLVWTVEGGGVSSSARYLQNQKVGTRLYSSSPGNVRDLGYIARFENPFANGAHVVSVAGITDFAERAGVEFLTDPSRSPDLARIFDEHPYAQVVYSADADGLRIIDVQLPVTLANGGGGGYDGEDALGACHEPRLWDSCV
ncbi:PIG-L deacetylase family protein [Dactylosporangium sp. NPDC048998]|uniref:PIG-L deacetylase family protein n=1 Tax=Dactylosporangium sp. NPDC048998 TaxID=3363976 RepID=UPI00371603C4